MCLIIESRGTYVGAYLDGHTGMRCYWAGVKALLLRNSEVRAPFMGREYSISKDKLGFLITCKGAQQPIRIRFKNGTTLRTNFLGGMHIGPLYSFTREYGSQGQQTDEVRVRVGLHVATIDPSRKPPDELESLDVIQTCGVDGGRVVTVPVVFEESAVQMAGTDGTLVVAWFVVPDEIPYGVLAAFDCVMPNESLERYVRILNDGIKAIAECYEKQKERRKGGDDSCK